ncbi:MAG TPA: hypothetical protein VH062_00845 [Polyangiaceae bacterium]|jgi:hypothetical protein|nr:hypothetical protein [Polyangiaceae bacterium]
MRALHLLSVGVLTACGVEQTPPEALTQGEDSAASSLSPKHIGELSQGAQFADKTVINETQLQNNGMSLLLTADGSNLTIQVFYLGDKTTDTGRTIAAPVLKNTVSLVTDHTTQVNVDLTDPAFAGNYGGVFLSVIGGGSGTQVFQTYVQTGFDMWSSGGSVFSGASYRIPYWSGCTGVVLTITNLSNFPFDIQFSNIGTTDLHTVSQLVPLSTYQFDSRRYNWNVSGTSAIQVTTTAGGTVYMSGHEYRGSTTKYRVVPVKAAPYP